MAKKKIQSKKTTKTKKHLTVHGLLGAISYWGSVSRMIITTMLILFAYMLNISGVDNWQYIDRETLFMIYGLGTIFVLDVGYVMVARALPISQVFDRWVVMLSDLLIAALFVIPSMIIMGDYGGRMRILSILVVLLLISTRILVGLVLSKQKRSR